jgi:EAL domain-containing protein (putative c-di-GMP-specific phosphodiesterase class I)
MTKRIEMRLRVLVVDRDASSAGRRANELIERGYDAVGVAASGAAEALMRESVDSIVCSDSVHVEIERIYGALIPVVRGEGQESAQIAKTLARLARRSMSPTAQLSLASQLDEAIANATLALEPIVHLKTGGVFAHRAALFPASLSQDDMERIAGELGRVRELRRAVRSLAFEAVERGAHLFVDLTLEDLMDPRLYDEVSHAKSVTFVIAERDVLVLAEKDARERLRTLRGLGFDLVVRIGTDIAGLTTVGVVVPSFAMIDLADFGESGPVVTRVVASVVAACREVNVAVIAGVSTFEHLTCARATGCALAVGPSATPGATA